MANNKQPIDITGNKYGRLYVISFSHTEKRRSYWKCACECGKIVILRKDYFAYKYSKQKVADACIVKIRQRECGNYTKDERRDKTSRNANHREGAEMEETKIFVEMSKSQYKEIKKALSDIADITQEHNRMILLTQSALTEDAGTVRIASPSAAKSLLDYVKS